MKSSEKIDALIKALVMAQAEIDPAVKDSTNPHFKSKFADITSVRDAILPHLNAHGLVMIQIGGDEVCPDGRVRIETILAHESGQYISGIQAAKPVKDDPQGLGSCTTYLRRYGASAMVFLVAEDDDGEAATRRLNDLAASQAAQRQGAQAFPAPGKATEAPDMDGSVHEATSMIDTILLGGTKEKPLYKVVAGETYTTGVRELAEKAKAIAKAGKFAKITYVETKTGLELMQITEGK